MSEKRELEVSQDISTATASSVEVEVPEKKQKTEETTSSAAGSEIKPKGVQEQEVGITTYISTSLPGFTGTIKQRYTDFQVYEIGLDGEVVRLNDQGLDIPEKQKKDKRKPQQQQDQQQDQEKKEELKEEKKQEEEEPQFQLDPANRIKLLELFGEEELTAIETLLQTPPNTNPSFSSTKLFDSKQTRGEIHQLFRAAFEGKLDTKTTADNTFQFTLTKRSSRINKHLQQAARDQNTKDANGVENWGAGPTTRFLHFTLYKENKETMECASLLGRFLRLQPKDFHFAGTKDRRGITTQRVCLHKARVERLNQVNKTLRGFKLGGFQYRNEDLSLGDLKGNEFVITIRDVKGFHGEDVNSDDIQRLLDSLQENGFVNYYGMQRFGTFSVSTHAIGKEILLSRWWDAVDLLLSDQEITLPESKPARALWSETHDAKQVLELMPRKCIAECAILKHLANCKHTEEAKYKETDCFFAISKIPRNLRIMYGHAYQSYVWNCVASERVKLFGMNVVEGDLVLDSSSPVNEVQQDDEFEEDVRKDQFVRARSLTAEEASSGKYTIFDVVLPTPGFDITYPTNQKLFETYQTVMAKDGLDPKDMTRKVKEFSFAGSYRRLISKPSHISHELRRYDTNTDDIVLTDLELLQKGISRDHQIKDDVENGEKLALVLKFRLDTASYATMVLREIMKCDTSRHGEVCDVKN